MTTKNSEMFFCGLKKIEWRGVCYELGKDNTVKLIEYIPYAEVKNDTAQKTDEAVSL